MMRKMDGFDHEFTKGTEVCDICSEEAIVGAQLLVSNFA